MKMSRTNLASVGLMCLTFAAAFAFYGRLPDPMPIHWSSGGEVDSYMAKPWGVFLMPLTVAGVLALFLLIPRVAPAGSRIDRFRNAFEIVQVTLLGFLCLATLLMLLVASGVGLDLNRIIHTAVGVLFIVLGNFLSKFTKNYFIGIRTPWTLASEEVWLRTHRLGGRLFVLGGLIFVLNGLLGGGSVPVFVAVAMVAGVPWVYSFILYRRIEGLGNGHPNDRSSQSR